MPKSETLEKQSPSKPMDAKSLLRSAVFLAMACSAFQSSAASMTAMEFSKVRADLGKTVKEEVLRTLNGPDGAIFVRKSDAFFRTSLKTATSANLANAGTKSKQVKLKYNPKAHLDEIADKITDLLMADALVGDNVTGRTKAPPGTPQMNKVDVSQLDILIRDPNYQVLQAKTVQTVQQNLEGIEKNFPDGEATTRFSRISCSEPNLHGGLTEYSVYDSETQTLEFCSRYLPMKGDLATWEATLSPNADREPASTQNVGLNQVQNREPESDDFKVALSPDDSIPSTDTYAPSLTDNGSLDLHPGEDFGSGAKSNSSYAGSDEVHRGPASLSAAEKIRSARLAKNRKQLPPKIRAQQAGVQATARNQTQAVAQVPANREVHTTTSSSVAAVSGQLSSNTGIRRSQIPSTVHEGFEFRLQYGRLITTFWVVNRGPNYDLVYANSSGSRVTIGIPVTSFSYLQETAESVHHDVNDISRCPAAKIQMHIVSDGEKEQTISACVQGKTKAAADLRAMGNLLSTLVR